MSWRTLSSTVLSRLPTEEHLVKTGILTSTELDLIRQLPNISEYDRYMIPIVWSFNLLNKLKQEKVIDSFQGTNAKEYLEEYFDSYKKMWIYSFLSVPLTYTQVAYLATHAFFFVSVISSQPILNGDSDTYIPFFMLLQFFFYMGWLAVAEALIDPYGDDDDDYEMNYMLDSNLRNAFFIADQIDEMDPEILVPGIMSNPVTRSLALSVHTEYVDENDGERTLRHFEDLDIKWPREVPHTVASAAIDEIIPLGNDEIRAYKPSKTDMEIVDQAVEFLTERVLDKASHLAQSP